MSEYIKEKINNHKKEQEHMLLFKKDELFLTDIENKMNNQSRWLSSVVSSFLIEEFDDLDFSLSYLKNKFQSCFFDILNHSYNKKEKVIFFNEIIPGFTVLLIKKNGWDNKTIINNKNSSNKIHDNYTTAISDIMKTYIQRTQNNVFYIDTIDINILLFPINKFKQQIKELLITYTD